MAWLTAHCPGLDYVSCSPFRLPIAMLAGAQAAMALEAAAAQAAGTASGQK